MADHSQRAHATWSASATSRNWNCAGALALTQQVAHLDRESEAAAWGTACHFVSEDCLKSGRDAVEWIDRTVKTKEFEIEVDEELAETAQTYVTYVRGRADEAALALHRECLQIEQRFSLEKINPPFDAGGTADAVIYFPDERLLEVIDLKGGRGVKVDVVENKQLRTYALGALLANPGLDVERVMSTIVQPRVYTEPKSETYHVTELMDWTGELRAAMQHSAIASWAYGEITGDITREEWADTWLKAGDHCTFCPAAGFCPKLEKRALDAAGVWFDDLSQPQLRNTPAELSPERLAQMLDAAGMIQDYLNACRNLAYSLAESGVAIPNYQLSEKIGRRRWKNEDELPAAADMLGIDDIYTQKLLSPAQLEKKLGKNKALIADLIETPITGKSLVRSDKTTRKAVAPAAHHHFQPIE